MTCLHILSYIWNVPSLRSFVCYEDSEGILLSLSIGDELDE